MSKKEVKSALFLFALLLLVATTKSQFTNPGCSSFSAQNKCLACHDRYYLLAGICFPVNPLCLTYNSTNGNCLSCYEGFMLVGSSCVPIPEIPFCLNYSAQGQCKACSDRYYLTPEGSCFKVDQKCQNYSLDGNCTSCINGYLLYQQKCVVEIKNCSNQTADSCISCISGYLNGGTFCYPQIPNCQTYDQGICTVCLASFTLTGLQCVKNQLTSNTVSQSNKIDNCTTYDAVTLECLACEAYFQLIQGYCLPVPDPFCFQFNNTECIQCSQGYIFDSEGHCINSDPLCKTHDSQGFCLSCFNGFYLNNKKCVIMLEVIDPYCCQFNGSSCLKCSKGYRFDSKGKCITLDVLCQVFNETENICLECYKGFMIGDQGTCVPITEIGCLTWVNQSCQSCSKGYYLFKGHCTKMDPFCSVFNYSSLTCQNCYPGYVYLNSSCQLIPPSHNLYNCAQISSNYTCSSCYFGFYLFEGQCKAVDPLCRTFKPDDGTCTSCYRGYFLIQKVGKCFRMI